MLNFYLPLAYMEVSDLREWLVALSTLCAAIATAFAAHAAMRSARSSEDAARASREMTEAELRGRLNALIAEVVSRSHTLILLTRRAVADWEELKRFRGGVGSDDINRRICDLKGSESVAELLGLEAHNAREMVAAGPMAEVRAALVVLHEHSLELARRERLAVGEQGEVRVQRLEWEKHGEAEHHHKARKYRRDGGSTPHS